LKDLFMHLPAAKITQIKAFTPAAWAQAKAMEQMVAQAARRHLHGPLFGA
jgi:hypothetical protein